MSGDVGPRRIGLVLGAGGPVGHAYECGVLAGIAEATGWDPRLAEIVIGTSAGAQVAALLRAGMTAADLAARVMEERLSPAGAEIARHHVRPSHSTPHPDHPPRFMPGDVGHVLRSLARPWNAHPGAMLAALLPPGRASLEAQAQGFRDLFGNTWPERALWIPALRLDTGQLVPFGHAGAPPTDVGTAVIASGCVPVMCVPVEIGGHSHVDGSFISPTNADLLIGVALDLIIVLSPLSSMRVFQWLLGREVDRVRQDGTQVAVFEPSEAEKRVMGWNPMDTARAAAVVRIAWEATRRRMTQITRPESLAALST
jgi:NTE family protein